MQRFFVSRCKMMHRAVVGILSLFGGFCRTCFFQLVGRCIVCLHSAQKTFGVSFLIFLTPCSSCIVQCSWSSCYQYLLWRSACRYHFSKNLFLWAGCHPNPLRHLQTNLVIRSPCKHLLPLTPELPTNFELNWIKYLLLLLLNV